MFRGQAIHYVWYESSLYLKVCQVDKCDSEPRFKKFSRPRRRAADLQRQKDCLALPWNKITQVTRRQQPRVRFCSLASPPFGFLSANEPGARMSSKWDKVTLEGTECTTEMVYVGMFLRTVCITSESCSLRVCQHLYVQRCHQEKTNTGSPQRSDK